MSGIGLRNGVDVVEGIEENGSPYYLIDDVHDCEWHISVRCAAYLLGENRRWDPLSDDETKAIDVDLLEKNHLRAGDVKPDPKIPWYQRLISINIPIVKPHDALVLTKPIWNWLFSQYGVALVIVLLITVLSLLAGSYNNMISYFGNYSDSKLWMFFALVLAKVGHELGHAMAFVKYRAYVPGINIVLLAGMPLPKTAAVHLYNTTYQEKVIIGLAGIYVEFILALICVLLWLGLPDGGLRVAVHFVAVVSLPLTVMFNLVPLMKFDGYYVLQNLFRNPRLYEDAIASFRNACYQTILGIKPRHLTLQRINQKGLPLVVYGGAIFIWKIFLPLGIAYAISVLFGASFMDMASHLPVYSLVLLPFIGMWLMPALAELKMIKESYSMTQHTYKTRTVQAISIAVSAILLTWFIAPMTHIETVQGAVLRDNIVIRSPIDGFITALSPRRNVRPTSNLASIHSPSLVSDMAQTTLDEGKALNKGVEIGGDLSEARVLRSKATTLSFVTEAKQSEGLMKSLHEGVWEPEKLKSVIKMGDEIGRVYLSTSQYAAFIPDDRVLPSRISAVALFKNGNSTKISLMRVGLTLNKERFPEYVGLSDESYQFYTSDNISGVMGQSLDILVKRKYSLAARMLWRIRSRAGLG